MYNSSHTTVSALALIQLIAFAQTIHAETPSLYNRLDGVFVSDGYGYVTDLRSDQMKVYHLSGESCVLDVNTSEYIETLITADTVTLSADGNSFDFGSEFEPHKRTLTRVDQLPAPCLNPTPDTPQGNFDAFVAAFSAHYAFFDLYGVNWNEVVAQAQTKVTPDMTDEALFYLFADMIAPLSDGHLSLQAEINDEDFDTSPDTTILSRGMEKRQKEIGAADGEVSYAVLEGFLGGIADDILNGDGDEYAHGKIQAGIIDGNVGYMSVLMLMEFTGSQLMPTMDAGSDADDYRALNNILDDILTKFVQEDVSAVIIDATINFGGSDYLGRAIAARFAENEQLAYSKRAYDAQGTTATDIYVTPSDRASFYGPVYLMTTDSTGSAGEIMTMSLRALPNVTHMGQSTNGGLSDILSKVLPNGWNLSLSNEIYLDHEGVAWEGLGIAPDVALQISSEADLLDGHQAAVATVLDRIKSDLAK